MPVPRHALPCWITWVNSCANSRLPTLVSGAYCPAPNTTSCPTVKANAFTSCANSAARVSVCNRTWLKSYPKRGSKNARTDSGRSWSPPLLEVIRVSKSGVTSEETLFVPPDRRSTFSSSLRCWMKGVICFEIALVRNCSSSFPHGEFFACGQIGFL